MSNHENNSLTAYYAALCARTKAAREQMLPPVWSMQTMATRLGVTLDAYKKYESRSPLPHHLIPLFCEFTHVTREYLLGETPELKTVPKVSKKIRKSGPFSLPKEVRKTLAPVKEPLRKLAKATNTA